MEGTEASKKKLTISSKVGGRRQLIGSMKSFFQWIASRVSSEAKDVEVEKDQEKQRKRLLSRYPLGELVSGGEGSIGRLEEARNEFLLKAGQAGVAFVSRHVDPVLFALRNFVRSLRENKAGCEPVASGVKSALGTVELIALARDEHRPWKKIRESTEYQARQALLEDVAFLMAYPTELLANMGIVGPEQAITLRKIEEALQPILLKFEKLLAKHPIADDFYSLFTWRSTLDIERQNLHDIGLKVVEEMVAPFKLKFSIEDDSFFWLGQGIETLSFEQLFEAFQYLFDLVKLTESFRSDERVLRFFARSKEQLHSLLHSEEELSEEERMRLFHTIRLIEELIGTGEES